MLRSFQQMIDSEAFEKRKKKIAGVIVVGYAVDERGKRRRRGGGEGERHGDVTRRMSSSLINSNEQRISLYVKNAEK